MCPTCIPPYCAREITQIKEVIDSFTNIKGLEKCHKVIVLDGYQDKMKQKVKMKKGIITKEMAINYADYKVNLEKEYPEPLSTVIQMPSHHGFALCAKHGLEQVKTKYAFLIQHDRRFDSPKDGVGPFVS